MTPLNIEHELDEMMRKNSFCDVLADIEKSDLSEQEGEENG